MLADVSSSVRFQRWFPYFQHVFSNTSETVCNASLQAYLADHLHYETRTCYLQLDCMLANTRESTKAHLSAAAVILGLTPTLLSAMGPSITELALLSSKRPILSFLIAMGSPAICPNRLLDAQDPYENIRYKPGAVAVPAPSGIWAFVLSALEYVLVMGCIANIIQTSFDLGDKTILVWACNAGFTPLAWSLAPAVIHLAVYIPINCSIPIRSPHLRSRAKQADAIGSIKSRTSGPLHISEHRLPFWRRETTLFANQPDIDPHLKVGNKIVIFVNLGVILGILHVLVGTVIFSSLTFISVIDSFTVIVRYGVSAAVCRFILVMEFASMKHKDKGSENSR
ncbi:MAG: hypothetical protein M1818_008468 [Claussenomyces sp. TS43310]|nr:MAG: hypothetical protein M1818_008468 [Claussenomyces sp. TS43310]